MNKREAKIISDKIISALIEKQKSADISNYKIAKETGLSESALSYIKDFKQNPQLVTLIMIADSIGASLSEIFKKIESDK